MLSYVADVYGMINNLLVTMEENTMPLTLQDDPQMVRSMDVSTALYAVCSVFHLTFFQDFLSDFSLLDMIDFPKLVNAVFILNLFVIRAHHLAPFLAH